MNELTEIKKLAGVDQLTEGRHYGAAKRIAEMVFDIMGRESDSYGHGTEEDVVALLNDTLDILRTRWPDLPDLGL